MTRRLVVLSLSALALVLTMVAPAAAATPELRGVVSGSPYGASQGYIAVPVLYSKMTARRTGLKSPVGLMVVKRTARIPVSGDPSTLPVGLRVGDRFKGKAEVSDLNKRIFYPRITFDRPPRVYFRSKELSLAELTRMILAVEKNLTALGKFTFDGFNLTAAQIAGLQKQLDDLKKLIAGLPQVDLSGLQSQIDALNKQVADLLASLANYALKTDLNGLLNAAGVQALIDTALAGLSIPSTQTIQALIDASITNLLDTTEVQDLIDTAVAGLDIPSDADIQALIDGSIGDLASQAGLDAATADITQLQTDLAAAEANIETLCTAIDDASVTLDPDGGGLLPQITVPVDLGTAVGTICP